MLKKLGLFLMLLTVPCCTFAAEPDTKSVTSVVRTMPALLNIIKETEGVKNFTEEELNRRSQSFNTAHDGKSKGPGFALTVPGDAGPTAIDRCTLESILAIQNGQLPVGFSHFWPVYAKDAEKLGLPAIAAAFLALHAMENYKWNKSTSLAPVDEFVNRYGAS